MFLLLAFISADNLSTLAGESHYNQRHSAYSTATMRKIKLTRAEIARHEQGRRRLPSRFIVTGLLFLLPLAVLLYDFQGEIGRGLHVARLERDGVAYSRPLTALLLDSVQSDSDPSKQPAVGADIAAMDQADQKYGQTLSTNDDWCRLRAEWLRLHEANLTPEQQRERQTHFEQGLADLLTTTGNTSNLILDPEMDSYYTMDTCITQIPQIVIATGQTNAAAALLPTGSAVLPPVDQERIVTLRGQVSAPMVTIRYDIGQVTKATPVLRPALCVPTQALDTDVQAYVGAIQDDVNSMSHPKTPPSPVAVYQASRDYDQAALRSLDGLLAQRIAVFAERRDRVFSVTAVCTFFALLFFAGLYRVTMTTLRQAQEAERRIAEAASREVDMRLQTVISSVPVVVFALDTRGVFTFADGQGLSALETTPAEMVGRSIFDVYAGEAEMLDPVPIALAGFAHTWTYEVRGRHHETHMTPLHDDDGTLTGVVGVAYDLTEHKRLERQLAHQAFHDSLTGLPNRALFLDRLAHALARSERQGSAVAVLFVDLDNFKVVNDSLGHSVGDALLSEVAARLGACARTGDTVARLGGDEFTLLLEDLPCRAGATDVAARIADALAEPLTLEGRTFSVTASIGLALSSLTDAGTPGTSGDDLLREADVAMYQAKNGGKARWMVFDRGMNSQAQERMELEGDLRHAIAASTPSADAASQISDAQGGDLILHYQPIVDLDTGILVEVEALVRWRHPSRGLIPPLKFIPIAEECGMIADLGQWVLREACRQTHRWQQDHPQDIPLVVGVNLSLRQLENPGLVPQIARILAETRLPPSCLKLEITESVMMGDTENTIACLEALKALGVRIAVDDFGTGYSSMAYLSAFPLDTLKIDRAFVSRLNQPDGLAIVQAIVTLAYTLGLEITSEGIETETQWHELQALGCHLGQGYFFAAPQTAEALEARLVALTSDDRRVQTWQAAGAFRPAVKL